MTTELQDRIKQSKLEEARRKFAGHVQSIAFNMTLSRNMIEVLHMLRDLGEIPDRHAAAFSNPLDPIRMRINSYSVPLMRSLSHRGLVWHDVYEGTYEDAEQNDHKWHKLTRAGELMCELLVEAGLMPAARSQKKKRSA